MTLSKYLVWIGFFPPADVGKKQIRHSCLNQVSLAANLEMHASQQKDFDLKYKKTIKVVKRCMSKEKTLPTVTGLMLDHVF